ncbi:T9SS type A sorting domain-containing protein [Aestuariibaculum sp. YM273]|uniref:Ig-like domain-containing protein n=1 Tax=Aestuariibaculum sp. YM273 TaxID=3070659 RepID=UPI0027DE7202|nr:T9SS type A sorting domain-containing protein [Aestuariibaculum sp. YM273]WMI66245.1 T9SS type A sorting domain-containing protein [Aestuariibaculum sp. YM273]
MKKKFLKVLMLAASVFWGYAQNPVVKIDFDEASRQTSEVNDPDYTSWAVPTEFSDSKIINGVTFTVSKAGDFGYAVGSNWYKAGVQSPNFAYLLGDGVTVKGFDANQGGQIELRISGLESGNHTLLVFLNATDSETISYSPIDVSVDGNLVFDDVIPTVRALSPETARSIYLNFEATTGNDVVILFSAETSGDETQKNVMINGIELNTPNIFYQATNPIPSHNNEHVELNSGNILLEWTPAPSAVKQYVYFGTDEMIVDEADTSSAEYKGSQGNANNSYQVNGLYTGDTYYWRIDQETSEGLITKGNVWRFRPAQLAFPGAEGYGRFARGGRGGKVVVVTNLNDNGPGSLREAVTNDIGPRTIVFNVSGIIQLQSRLVCNQPYVTIAGQTAPGKGITIRSAPFGVTGNDNVVQNIRVRLGGGQTYDGMGLTGANHSIIDHCSISWTIDEAFSSRGAQNITLQRTLISEALNAAGHDNYEYGTEHGYAASIGGDIGSFHHNLLAHNYGRNWSLAGGLDGNGYYSGLLDITNNVVYNWGSRTTDGGTKELNFVGNYYKPGPGMQLERYALTVDHENVGMGMQRAYFADNVMPGYFDETNQEYGRRSRDSNGAVTEYETFVDTPFFPSYVTTQSAELAYKLVLSDVGCNQPVFDDHDIRMINETLNGTYSVTGSYTGKKGFPDDEADAGGFEDYPVITRAADWDSDSDGLPNWWETIIGTNVNSPSGDFSDANADDNADGYTNLDYYLQWMSLPHFSTNTGEAISVNLQELSRGFTNNPTYQVSNEVNGNANLTGDTVEFTPSASGLASFDFTVSDSDGDSMTRTVNIVNGYDITLSTEIKKLSEVKIWPIPNRGTFYVNTGQRDENTEYKLFDILGREVSKGIINVNETKEINLNMKGVFVIKLYEPSGKIILHTQKLIVQ